MEYSHQRAVLHLLESKKTRIKFFLVDCPVKVDDLLALEVFESASLPKYAFEHMLLTVLRHEASFDTLLHSFLERIKHHYASAPIDVSLDEVIGQTYSVITRLKSELTMFEMYVNGNLLFNTLWLDQPYTVTFFRMEAKDV